MKNIKKYAFSHLQNPSMWFILKLSTGERIEFIFNNFSEKELLLLGSDFSEEELLNIFNNFSEDGLGLFVKRYSSEQKLLALNSFNNDLVLSYRRRVLNKAIEDNFDGLYLFARRFVNCDDDAKDTIQDVAVALWLYFSNLLKVPNKKFEEINLKSYLFSSVKHEGFKFKPNRRKQGYDSLDDLPYNVESKLFMRQDQVYDFILDNAKTMDRLVKAVGEDNLNILLLYTVQDKSYEQIGAMLNMNPNTVGVRIYRTKRILKDFLTCFKIL
jgi:RNA polymerase sigma factor (sigma-70 family)